MSEHIIAESRSTPPPATALARRPGALPAATLTNDALARRGLDALAKSGVRVERLPDLPTPAWDGCLLADDKRDRLLLVASNSDRALHILEFSFARWSWRIIRTDGWPAVALAPQAVVFDTVRDRLVWLREWGPGSTMIALYGLELSAAEEAFSWGILALRPRLLKDHFPWGLAWDRRGDRFSVFTGPYRPDSDGTMEVHLRSVDLRRHRWRHTPTDRSRHDRVSRSVPWWLSSAVMDVHQERMVLLGGADNAGRLGVELYDCAQNTWQRPELSGPATPGALVGHAVVRLEHVNALLVHGGVSWTDEGLVAMRDVWKLDPAGWQAARLTVPSGQQLPARFFHAACYCPSRRAVCFAGGRSGTAEREPLPTDAYLLYVD